MNQRDPAARPHYGRNVGVLGLLALPLITINTALRTPNGATGASSTNGGPWYWRWS